jgi:hypothetical protein
MNMYGSLVRMGPGTPLAGRLWNRKLAFVALLSVLVLACSSTSTNDGGNSGASGGSAGDVGSAGAGSGAGTGGVGGVGNAGGDAGPDGGSAGSGGNGPDGGNIPDGGVCAPGALRCSGNLPQSCDANGQWHDGGLCPYVCTGGNCTGECSPGTKQCDGKTPRTCDAAGAWKADATCTGALPQCSGGACVDACGGTCTYANACPSVANATHPYPYAGPGWIAQCVPQPPAYDTGICTCKCTQQYTCMTGGVNFCKSNGC